MLADGVDWLGKAICAKSDTPNSYTLRSGPNSTYVSKQESLNNTLTPFHPHGNFPLDIKKRKKEEKGGGESIRIERITLRTMSVPVGKSNF